MRSTYIYRLLKSSWGIRIKITASSEEYKHVLERETRPGRVSVHFSDAATEFADELRSHIVDGLAMIEGEIVQASGGADVSVTFEEIGFNDADFQAEGLSVAVIRWAEQHFNLPEHLVEESFDKSSNRYTFNFP